MNTDWSMLDNLGYVAYACKKIVADAWFKLSVTLIYSVASFFFDPNHKEALIALLALIIIDWFLGVITAKKLGQEIKSGKFFRSVLKIVIYYTLVACALLTERAGLNFLPIDETVIMFLAGTELISVMEHSANLGYVVPKKLLNKIKEYTESQ